ncbi:MAG: hypothetical protein HQL10_10120 [Nitrospirae bacterium]|nr:hypothetical protein [Nitrospirota bacterium]
MKPARKREVVEISLEELLEPKVQPQKPKQQKQTSQIKQVKQQQPASKKPAVALFFIGAVVLLSVLYLIFGKTVTKPESVSGDTKQTSPYQLEKRDAAGMLPGQEKAARDERRATIKLVKLSPEQPTIFDSVKAVISLGTSYSDKVEYLYQWSVNEKPVPGANGETLKPGVFKKGDRISVQVVPVDDGREGYPYNSAFVIVHGSLPTLEMSASSQKANGDVEFQMIGKDPDGDKLTFALEQPLLEGMTIDKDTGKLVYKNTKKEKGTYNFRVSVADPDGMKVSKTFSFSIGEKSSAQ